MDFFTLVHMIVLENVTHCTLMGNGKIKKIYIVIFPLKVVKIFGIVLNQSYDHKSGTFKLDGYIGLVRIYMIGF